MPEQPNVILIMTDHFRPDALGSSTPTLTQLANAGACFTNAYCASPLCQPARVSIVTGMLPSQHGVCGNMADPIHEDLRHDTFMRHLQRSGYFTAMIGKHHYIDRYGMNVDVTEDDEEIMRYGFDEVIQVVDAGENLHNECRYTKYLRECGRIDAYRKAQRERAWTCDEYPLSEADSEDGFIGRTGCEFIERYTGERPFYLNLSFVGPHPPYWHPGELNHDPERMDAPHCAPDSSRARTLRAHYLDKCAVIDRMVGALLKALDARNLREKTVIIFTSDHGDNLGDYGIWDKRFFYEQSAGVPLLMNGPGVSLGARNLTGKISKALVSHLDIYPTVLNIAGVDVAGQNRLGYNLMSILSDDGPFHDKIYSQLGTAVMLRTANWKMVFDPQQGGVQYLFNLAVDPGEEQNLAGVAGYERITAELVEQILADYIRLFQYTHDKEEHRLQRVHIG